VDHSGLIDAHVHVATDPNGSDRRDRVELRLRNALLGGVVAVRDMGGDARALADLSRAAVTGQIVSPLIRYSAIMAGPEFFTDPRVRASSAGVALGSRMGAAVRSEEDFRQIVAEAKGAGATGIKLYADLDSGRIARLADEARRQGLSVWAHAAMNLATPSAIAGACVQVMSHSVLLTREATPPMAPGSGRPPFDYSVKADDAAILRAIAAMKRHGVVFEPTLFVFAHRRGADTSVARRRGNAPPSSRVPPTRPVCRFWRERTASAAMATTMCRISMKRWLSSWKKRACPRWKRWCRRRRPARMRSVWLARMELSRSASQRT
jgi:hypothetical protein